MISRTAATAFLLGILLSPEALGHIIISEPNGGETYTAGEAVTIRWNIGIAHDLQNWDLWYTLTDPTTNTSCINLAGTWTAIEMDIAPGCTQGGGGLCSPGPCETVYEWTIPPGVQSDQVKIRVRMDNSATDYWDVSDAPFTITRAAAVEANAPRSPFSLSQNQPNPFNPSTVIAFVLDADVPAVRLTIHDSRGALIRRLVDGPTSAGPHAITWDGVDSHGTDVPSGIYFYRLETAEQRETRKMVLVK